VLALPSVPSILFTEPLALDLMNTDLHLNEGRMDLLDQRSNRTEWLAAEAERLGINDTDVAAFTDAVAEALKAVRAHTTAAVEAARYGTKPPSRALSGLNKALRTAPAIPRARWDGTSVTVTAHRSGPLATRLTARFAEAAVGLLTDPDISKVRRCAAPPCMVLFLPRNPNRRWCTPNICGNRARVARYALRHRSDRADPRRRKRRN